MQNKMHYSEVAKSVDLSGMNTDAIHKIIDEIIEEKIGGKSWLNHLNNSPSLFVNATTFGLFLAEQVVELDPKIGSNPISWLSGMTSKIGEPVLREAIKKGMDILSEEFVSGTSIEKALTKFDSPNTPCSFDMLGKWSKLVNFLESVSTFFK